MIVIVIVVVVVVVVVVAVVDVDAVVNRLVYAEMNPRVARPSAYRRARVGQGQAAARFGFAEALTHPARADGGGGVNNLKHNHRTLPHHRLRIYGTARALRRLVANNPIGDANLRRHASEAASSVVLNIGEGAALWGAAKKRHYRIACGSALEVAAAYEAAEDCGERFGAAVAEIFAHVDHVAAVMTKLTRR